MTSSLLISIGTLELQNLQQDTTCLNQYHIALMEQKGKLLEKKSRLAMLATQVP